MSMMGTITGIMILIFWLGIGPVGQVASAITAKLIELDADQQQQYQDNLVRFLANLAEQDNTIGEKLKPVTTVPYYVFMMLMVISNSTLH